MKTLSQPVRYLSLFAIILATALAACAAPSPTPTPKPPPPAATSPSPAPKPSPTTSPTPAPAPSPSPTPKPTPTLAPGPAPTLKITAPTATVSKIGDVAVSIEVTNFKIVSSLGQANVPGEGHVHYFMDVDAPTTAGRPAVTAPGTYAASANTNYVWRNVPSGAHTFSVELTNNNHTPLIPPVIAKVSVQITPAAGPPALVIATPRENAAIPAGSVTITVQAANFNLVSKLGQATVAGEGHIHFFMDVDAPTDPARPAVTAPGTYAAAANTAHTWANVPAGTHTFSAELVNNDHKPLDPPVVARISLRVTAPAPPAPPAPTPAPGAKVVTVNLSAQSFKFDMGTISVPAGATVTVNFTNKDPFPHNFAIYQKLAGGQTKPIFVGATINNTSTVYTFTAPADTAAEYFFDCDVHPTMNGSFSVTTGGGP